MMGGKQAKKSGSKQLKADRGKDEGFTLMLDEYGDKGDKKQSSNLFGFGVTITDRGEEMGIIAKDVRGDRIELKSRDATEAQKDWVVTRISRLKPETYGNYIDKRKKDHPEIWEGKDRAAAYRRVRIAPMFTKALLSTVVLVSATPLTPRIS